MRRLPSPVESAPDHAVRCLKAAGARSVWLVARPGERPRTLKSWPASLLLAIKFAVGGSQPQRHVREVRRLGAARVATPPVARGPRWVRRGGTLRLELELEHIEGRTALEVLREPDAPTIGHAAAAIAVLLRRLIAARLFNRDLKLSNILIADGPEHRAWLLDPVGVRRLTDPRRQVIRMLKRLGVEPREQGLAIPSEARRQVVDAARMALGAERLGRG